MLETIASVATIIESVFVIISVLFIWRELRINTKLSKASNTQSLVELSSPFNLQLIQDRQMAEYWVHGAENYADMDEVEKYRYISLLIWWLILHENVHYQYQNDLLDSSVYDAWDHDLETFVLEQKLWNVWPTMIGSFHADFAYRVSELIEKHAP